MALIINGETIDDEIIEEEFRHIKGHYERNLQVSCCERDPEFRAMAKDNLSSRALLNQEALKRHPDVTEDEISDGLAKLIEQAGGEDEFYANIGLPFKDESLVRGNVSNGVRMDKMLQGVYAPEPVPSDADMQSYYEANLSLFLTEEEVRASHISLNLSGAKTRQDAYNLMRQLREKALAGEDFDALGAEHNSNKETPPDLGWFKRGEFMEEFEILTFSMRKDEISPVFMTHLGFHLCKVTDRKPAVPKPFEEVKEIVRARLIELHRDDKFNAFVETLKGSAKVEDTDPDEAACGCH